MRSLILIPALTLTAFTAAFASDPELAVVVNKASTVATISLGDLRQMVLGEKEKWPDGKKVTSVETPPDSPERALALKTVFKMNEAVLKRYLMHAAFTGQVLAAPKVIGSAAALKEYVGRTPGAIGCILAADVDETVKVLKVDGASPGEPAYKLR
jgi:hypothetical protein